MDALTLRVVNRFKTGRTASQLVLFEDEVSLLKDNIKRLRLTISAGEKAAEILAPVQAQVQSRLLGKVLGGLENRPRYLKTTLLPLAEEMLSDLLAMDEECGKRAKEKSSSIAGIDRLGFMRKADKFDVALGKLNEQVAPEDLLDDLLSWESKPISAAMKVLQNNSLQEVSDLGEVSAFVDDLALALEELIETEDD